MSRVSRLAGPRAPGIHLCLSSQRVIRSRYQGFTSFLYRFWDLNSGLHNLLTEISHPSPALLSSAGFCFWKTHLCDLGLPHRPPPLSDLLSPRHKRRTRTWVCPTIASHSPGYSDLGHRSAHDQGRADQNQLMTREEPIRISS